jgi:hypothetical protein
MSLVAMAALTVAACGLVGGSESDGTDTGSGSGSEQPQPEPPPAPDRMISVAGVRLDNTTPDNSCVIIRNTNAGVPIRIVDVTFSQEGDQLVREDTHCPESIGDDATPTRTCSPGTTLPPGEDFADGCRIGAAPRQEGAPWNREPAIVSLVLEATCTDTEAAPCDQLTGADAPSGGESVTVRWTEEPTLLYLNPGSYPEDEVTNG